MNGNTAWIESLSPWPAEGFGLERMQALLAELGEPQRAFRSVHVVGTNGKSTTARMVEALLLAEGLSTGCYTSPHVSGWPERIRVAGAEGDFEQAVGRIRSVAERLGATQFEALTAAAFAEFAARGVDAAAVEAGLGGRLDATNVVDAPVVVLTNVALDHTDVLGETREEIAREKLAVVREGATVVLGEPEWEGLAREAGAGYVVHGSRSNLGLAVAAATELLGRVVDPTPAETVTVPGRLERRSESPLEIWAGAHNLAGLGWLLPRLPDRRFVVLASILADKDADRMLAALTAVCDTLVTTRSSSARAVPAAELAGLAAARFTHVEAVEDPWVARERALELAGPDGAVLVTGSLYLLADLSASDRRTYHDARR
jgi:dihydrofolate synthase/folylpolyglutamate synthase